MYKLEARLQELPVSNLELEMKVRCYIYIKITSYCWQICSFSSQSLSKILQTDFLLSKHPFFSPLLNEWLQKGMIFKIPFQTLKSHPAYSVWFKACWF